MEPCISAVADCLSWSTLDSVVAFLVQVCDEICPVRQLSRPLFQPCTDIKPLPEWKAEKVEYKMPTCVIATSWVVSCAEKDSICGTLVMACIFEMFGSMPWCSFPWHKLPPRLEQKRNAPAVWRKLAMKMVEQFDPWAAITKVIYTGLPRKAFPRK